jgi:[acyl-carrier-protein] S-malonyltransferase
MFNSPSQLVITGERSFLDEVAQKLSSQGASVETLKIEAPFHSLLLSKAASRVRTQLKELTFHPAKYEVISGLTGKPYKNLNSSSAKRKEEVVDNLSKQLTHPILWDKAMQEVHKKGIDTLLEISPRSLLIPLIEENSLNATSYPVRSGRDIKKVGKELGLNREEKIDILKKCLKIIVSTPNYNSKDEEYEKGVVKSYKKIQDMWLEAEKKKQPLSFEEVLLAVNMLHSALEAKKLSSKEHRQCLEELVDEKNKEIINRSEFKNVKK